MDFLLTLLRALLGLFVLLGICYLISENRKAIDWRTIGSGILLQPILAILILKVPGVSQVFDVIAGFFNQMIIFSKAGSAFIFGSLVTNEQTFGNIFAFQVLPTILFYSALASVLFYYGILQRVIYGLAWIMSKTMRLSGPESFATAANVFIGQTEAPLLIKPFLEKFTRSELLCLMAGGMATIAGGVFAAYVGFLGGDDPVRRLYFAKHLLTASILSAPAAIVAAKMIVPETHRKPIEEQLNIYGQLYNNVLKSN
jgi:CNT family concentrative nucleoside transporter